MRPVWLARLEIEAVKQAAEVGDEEQPILDRHRAAGAVHRLLEVEFAVAVSIEAWIVPDRGRVGIGPRDLALFLDDRLIATVGQGGVGILEAYGKLRARITALRRIDAPEVPDALAVLRILADGDVDEPFVNHRRADDVVAVGAATECVFRFFRIAVEFPEQLRLAVLTPRIERIEPAVAAAEEHLWHAAEFRIRRARPLPVQDVCTGRTVGPEHLAVALVDAKKAGSVGIRQVDVSLVHAVARVDEEQVARGRHAAGAHVVL